MPLILREEEHVLAADVGRRRRILEVFTRDAEEEVGVGVAGSCVAGVSTGVEVHFAVDVVVVQRVVLVRSEADTELPVVLASHPRKGVGVREGVIGLVGRALLAVADIETGIEPEVGGAGGLVGSDTHAK